MVKTLFDKIWTDHLVKSLSDGRDILYIDRHLIHEVTSPQAFNNLNQNGPKVLRPKKHFGVSDHNVPTTEREKLDLNSESGIQVNALQSNCEKYSIEYFGLNDPRQGIVHVIGPELGITQPGLTIVCGDSHTTTHGAFGAIAFGIGSSEIEHVLRTQTLVLKKPKNFLVQFEGVLPENISSKDIALYLISKIGASGGTSYAVEFQGEIVDAMSMEARMTLCNMGVEAGARFTIIRPDEKTFSFLQGRPYSPELDLQPLAMKFWKNLFSDSNAYFERKISLDISNIKPLVTWGTTLDMVIPIDGSIPSLDSFEDDAQKLQVSRALEYMGLTPGDPIIGTQINKAFIGSCTNARLSDLREAARIVKGKRISPHVTALVVPGSMQVKAAAEKENLHQVFLDAGFSWRNSGCSMCIGMNEDSLLPGERCASSSNRNFEGRQGRGGRTHIMSPAMVAAAAIAGKIVDVREY